MLQRLLRFRLIYLHYASLQNKLEFKLASVSLIEEKIQHKEQTSGALADQARQKVLAHACSQSYQGVIFCQDLLSDSYLLLFSALAHYATILQ